MQQGRGEGEKTIPSSGSVPACLESIAELLPSTSRKISLEAHSHHWRFIPIPGNFGSRMTSHIRQSPRCVSCPGHPTVIFERSEAGFAQPQGSPALLHPGGSLRAGLGVPALLRDHLKAQARIGMFLVQGEELVNPKLPSSALPSIPLPPQFRRQWGIPGCTDSKDLGKGTETPEFPDFTDEPGEFRHHFNREVSPGSIPPGFSGRVFPSQPPRQEKQQEKPWLC